jgi:hypothetical protein
VVNEAAAVAISAARYDTVLEWLEQDHSIVWNQLLQFCTPVDALCEVQPTLANDLVCVSKALDACTQDISTQLDQQVSMEEVAQEHCCLAEQWETLVNRTQDLKAFCNKRNLHSSAMPLKTFMDHLGNLVVLYFNG